MIKIENVETYGWETAIRGMRNPMNSWDKSDSGYCGEIHCSDCPHEAESERQDGHCFRSLKNFVVGKNDLQLMQKLANAGTDHSKFLRMITVTCDITAPRFWWTEADTYKVGTVRNSCSTMHKIHSKEFTLDDFSTEHLSQHEDDMWLEVSDESGENKLIFDAVEVLELTIRALNRARALYLETKDKKYWWQMIQLLPQSYNQRATMQFNYQVLRNIRNSDRRNHKLDEWRIGFMNWIDSLPYAEELLK